MIVLLRLRNLTIFALLILSISFIYIGYIGFGNKQIAEKQQEELSEEQVVIQEVRATNQENPLGDFPLLEDIEEVPKTENFYVDFRMKRDKGRDAQIEILRELVNNPNSSMEVRNKAQNKLFDISESISLEVKAENLLKAKGYAQAVVVIEKNNVTVVVKNDNLKETDITRISDLVMRATGYELEQIAIITK